MLLGSPFKREYENKKLQTVLLTTGQAIAAMTCYDYIFSFTRGLRWSMGSPLYPNL
jgi:hypothetical protein